MTTFHEQLAEAQYEHEIRDPAVSAGFHDFLKLARSGALDRLLPAIGFDARKRTDYAQMLAAWRIYLELKAGLITASAVHIGMSPERDREWKVNQLRLDAGLPKPYRAQVEMSHAYEEGDGILTWDDSITLMDCSTGRRHEPHVSRAVLEIGSTKPSRTLVWLTTPGYECVARWPYSEDIVHIYARRPQPYDRTKDIPAELRTLSDESTEVK